MITPDIYLSDESAFFKFLRAFIFIMNSFLEKIDLTKDDNAFMIIFASEEASK